MKKNIIFFIFLYPILLAALPVTTRARSAIVVNADNGEILYQKNPNRSQFPASITKLATLLYVVEQKGDRLDEIVTCYPECLVKTTKGIKMAHNYSDPPYFLEVDGTHFYIREGEKIALYDLLYGLMLSSGNDAANCIAHHISGSIPKFTDELNAYLKGIGCQNTHFKNPHGLHHPDHQTTAYDMALIAKRALGIELIQKIVSAKHYTRKKTNKNQAIKIDQHNKLLMPGKYFYPKAIGMKIGYTSDAGPTFVAAAVHEQRKLIAVLMGYQDKQEKYQDAITLFDAAFAEKKIRRILFNNKEQFRGREFKEAKTTLYASIRDEIAIDYFPSEEPSIEVDLTWNELSLPIKKDDLVGYVIIKNGRSKTLLTQASLYADHDIIKARTGCWLYLLFPLLFVIIIVLYQT